MNYRKRLPIVLAILVVWFALKYVLFNHYHLAVWQNVLVFGLFLVVSALILFAEFYKNAKTQGKR